VVEIAPDVVAAARQFFKLPEESPRLRIEIADGHDYLAAVRRRFELIAVDAFDAKGRSGMLDSIPFYLNCRARLADGGMVAVNLLDRRKGAKASLERLRAAFDGRVLELPPCEAGNTVAIAASGAQIRESFDELRAAATSLKENTGLNLLRRRASPRAGHVRTADRRAPWTAVSRLLGHDGAANSRHAASKPAMRTRHLRTWIAALLGCGSWLAASAQTPPPAPCSAPESRQFDFWIGDWDVFTPEP
jgi:hypothetical protein